MWRNAAAVVAVVDSKRLRAQTDIDSDDGCVHILNLKVNCYHPALFLSCLYIDYST